MLKSIQNHAPKAALAFVLAGLFLIVSAPAQAEDAAFLGPDACQKCHKSEMTVWEGTHHAAVFSDFHKSDKARDITKAVGDRSPKNSETCILCHYTAVLDSKGEPDPIAGPSCESCHGAASNWIEIHNDYGGQGVTAEQESPEHKAQRIADAVAAGMIRPEMTFDVARNCFTCHGLNNDALDPEIATLMLDAGHPANADFEFVAYSQGEVRHRFYPPEPTVNQEMTAAEKAEWYLVGQAASLVAATEGLERIDHPKYVESMNTRIARATEALSRVPEGASVLAAPTAANAQSFALAIAGQDLSGAVGDLLPTTYK
jgi:hypothetical protein